jgi:glucokinase
MQKLLGFDIGGTKCAVLIANYDGESLDILSKETIETDKNEAPDSILKRLCLIADKNLNNEKVDAIGVSCGGPLDSKRGVVMSPPNLPLWDNFSICEILSEHFGAPSKLQNDANACALAEHRLGAGRGVDNMVFLTFGTGLGAGLIIGGKLYEGANGNAGELGHIRLAECGPIGYGKTGSFEGFCSGGGIAQLGYFAAKEEFDKGNRLPYFYPEKPLGGISAKILAEAARDGDPTATEVYRLCGEYLGKGLSVIIDLLNPERIVIGSIFARSGDLLIPEMKKQLYKEALPCSVEVCDIVPASLGENIGDYGALITALS